MFNMLYILVIKQEYWSADDVVVFALPHNYHFQKSIAIERSVD